MNLSEIVKVFKEIEKEPSRIGKELILQNNEGNTEFREALEFLLNPYIITGISTKKMRKRFKKSDIDEAVQEECIKDFKSLIEYLKRHNSGKDVDIKRVQHFMVNQDDKEIGNFIYKFTTKDLKLGISAKTVNKVYGANTIPNFAVQLAESFEKKQDKIKGKFYVTLKLDGNRCVAIKENGIVKFFSRKGRPIEGMMELEEQFSHFPDGVYDGEILLINKDNLPSDQLFRATQKVVRKDGQKKNLEFYIFDLLPVSQFKLGKSKNTYEQRRNQLDILPFHIESKSGKPFDETCPNIHILSVLYEGDDKSVIPVLLKGVEEQGLEGLMINMGEGLYECKRTANLQKVKTMKSADLLVMGVEEGTGRNEGRLGAVLVEYKGGITKVGTGFSDEQRDYYWNNPDEITGKVIEVQFFEESKDEKTGLPSLRFPVFKGIRDDKTVEDINYGE